MSEYEKTKDSSPNPSQSKRYLVGFAICAIILGASSSIARYYWLNQEEAEKRTPPPTIPLVDGIRLQATNFTVHLPSQGRVQARAVTSINPEVSGRIISIEPDFKEGGFFKPGQKLLTLDNSDYLNAITKTEGSISQLKAKLALEKIGRASITNAFAVAQANLEQAQVALKLQQLERSSYSNAVTVAQANLKQAEANLVLKNAERDAAIANLKRINKLEGASDLAKREPQVAEAKANEQAKRATLEKAIKDKAEKPQQLEADFKAKIKVAEAMLIEARENLRRPAQLEAELLAQIKIAESEADQAQRNSKRTVIIAPQYHGRITEKRVDIGQVVNANTILATAIATDYAEVRLPISNHRLSYMNVPEQLVSTNNTEALNHQAPITYPAVKLTAQIGVDAHTWQGKIDRAESRYDSASQQLFLIAQVPEPYGHQPALRAGLFVRADITGNTLTDVFILPRHTVRRGNEVVLAIKKTGSKKPKKQGASQKYSQQKSTKKPEGPQKKGPSKPKATHILERKTIEILWRDEKRIITPFTKDDPDSLQPGDVLITTSIEYATKDQPLIVRIEGEPLPKDKPERKPGGGPNRKPKP